ADAEPARVRQAWHPGRSAALTSGRSRHGDPCPACRPAYSLYQCTQRRGRLLRRADRARGRDGMTRAAPARCIWENDCPTGIRSAIVPHMSIESPSLRETAAVRGERENDREEAMAHGDCEHWDHSRDSG